VPTTRPDTDALLERALVACTGLVATPEVRAFVDARADAVRAAHDPLLRMQDLLIAAGCACGDSAAIAQLNGTLAAAVRPALARLGLTKSDDDEIIQRVRVALLVPSESGSIGIAGYSGRGELRAYVRSVAVKLALKRMEREVAPSSENDIDALEMMPDAADTPAMRALKERCRGDLRTAFAVAFAEIEPTERTLLRQHYLDGLTIDALGRLHGVHRATTARWVESARENVLRGVLRYLRQALGLSEEDLGNVLELVRSQLDLSLSRHLPRITP
jgi:RNA polymerase sigma-70 factor, ECF subfamily